MTDGDLRCGDFFITTDSQRLDLDATERLLRGSYWASGRSRDAIESSLEHSLCFALFDGRTNRQVGLLRVVTDYATFAWLCDVVVEDAYRGRGLGKWLLEVALAHPRTKHVGRWILATLDAHALYSQYGFAPLARPERWMERISAANDCTQC
jgi:GNAT superfamily N-acetyltransferase